MNIAEGGGDYKRFVVGLSSFHCDQRARERQQDSTV